MAKETGVGDDLNAVIEEIKAYSKMKFVIFYGVPPDKGTVVYWDRKSGGTNYRNFLSVAENLRVSVIYISVTRTSEEMAKRMGHKDEIAFFKLSFIYDNVQYAMWMDSNWYMPSSALPQEKPPGG